MQHPSGIEIEDDNNEALKSNQQRNMRIVKLAAALIFIIALITYFTSGSSDEVKEEKKQQESGSATRRYESSPQSIAQLDVDFSNKEEEKPQEVKAPEPAPIVADPHKEALAMRRRKGAISGYTHGEKKAGSPSATANLDQLLSALPTANGMNLPTVNVNADDKKASKVRMIENIDYTLLKGTIIPCVLETNIVSEQPGFTRCVISQDVYSENARMLLIEKGTKVTGSYDSNVANGNSRLQIIWDRLVTPYHITVDLNSPTTDRLGASGIRGKVDNRWGTRIGSALLVSLISDALTIAADNSKDSQVIVESDTASTSQSLAERILDKNINLNPIIYIQEGTILNIYVADDIDFSELFEAKKRLFRIKRAYE